MSADLNTPEDAADAPEDHRVIVFAVPDELEPLEELIVETTGVDCATARLAARSLPGLIPQAISQHKAAAMAAAIRGFGVNAFAIPTSEIPNLSKAKQSHHVRVNADNLEVMDLHDRAKNYRHNDVQLISVGLLPLATSRRQESPSSLTMGSTQRSWSDGINVSPRTRPEAMIVMKSGEAIGVTSNEMNYEYLGDHLAASSTANFARMIGDVAQHAKSAWLTPSTRAFLDRGPVRHYGFRSLEDFRRYSEFQTLLSHQIGVREL